MFISSAFSKVVPGTRWSLCLTSRLLPLLKQTQRAADLSLLSQGMGPSCLSFCNSRWVIHKRRKCLFCVTVRSLNVPTYLFASLTTQFPTKGMKWICPSNLFLTLDFTKMRSWENLSQAPVSDPFLTLFRDWIEDTKTVSCFLMGLHLQSGQCL